MWQVGTFLKLVCIHAKTDEIRFETPDGKLWEPDTVSGQQLLASRKADPDFLITVKLRHTPTGN